MQKSMLKKGTVLVIIILFIGAGIVSGIICNKEIFTEPIPSEYKVGIKWNAGGVSSNEIATWFSGCIIRVWDNNILYKIDNTNWTEIEVYGDASIDYNHSSGIYFSGDSNTEALCRIVHSDYIPFNDYYLIEMKPQFVSGWGSIGIIFNFQDTGNFNEIFLSWNNICHITYHQFIDGEIDGYWEIETSFSAGTYDLKLEVNNTDGTCKIYVDDVLKGIVDIRLPPDTVYVDDDYDNSTPGWGYDHFDKIQDGIDAVNENGTVFVNNGIYYENVVVGKTINLFGEDRNTTIIDGSGSGDVVHVSADRVLITGFTIQNGGNDNWLDSGIDLRYISNSTITGNNIIENNRVGICSYYSNNNNITYNNISNNYECILNMYSTGNTIINNIISNSDIGITLGDSGSNTIICNIIMNNFHAIDLDGFINNVFNNKITGNNIKNNTYGIMMYNGQSNLIFHNNFFNNIENAYDEFNNNWDDGYYSGGNYWSDFDEPSEGAWDNDSDGIVDLPYPIPGGSNQDYYPLIHPWGENPPVANFSYYYNTAQIIFDGSFSYDRDGEIVSYEWDFGDGTTGNGEIIVHKFCEIGTYDVTLTVTDDDGLEDNITKSAEIILANIPPSTPEVYGPNSGKPGEEIEYVFFVTDPDGDDAYLWVDWSDGDSTGWIGALGSDDQVKLSHAWNESGTYTIMAKVKDFCAESEWVTLEVSIPRNKPFNLLSWLFERFPLLEKLLSLLL